ncbi:MAG: NAD(P)-dependent oxidoreductase [Elusimicrobia bacterium]|nr:NAD(P)-dependent oxidoreductase [Elusimicrobiota bacterium]
MRHILITGGSGYVGKAFIAAFGRHYRLRLFSRTPAQEGMDCTPGDIRRFDDVLRASRGVDAILHLAALTTDDKDVKDAEFFETNTVGTFNVLEAAVQNKVKKVVYGSSVCAVGFRGTPRLILETDRCEPTDGMYGYSKYLSERLCECYAERHKTDIICLRTAMVVPQHELAAPANPLARHWLGAVHIDDVVEALRLALDNTSIHFGVFHVATGNPHSKFDIRRARRLLGYAPKHDLEEFIRRPPGGLVKRLAGKARDAFRRIRSLGE